MPVLLTGVSEPGRDFTNLMHDIVREEQGVDREEELSANYPVQLPDAATLRIGMEPDASEEDVQQRLYEARLQIRRQLGDLVVKVLERMRRDDKSIIVRQRFRAPGAQSSFITETQIKDELRRV